MDDNRKTPADDSGAQRPKDNSGSSSSSSGGAERREAGGATVPERKTAAGQVQSTGSASQQPAAHRAPAAPAVMVTEPWEDNLTRALAAELGDGITQFAAFRGQHFAVVKLESAKRALTALHRRGFDYLVDVTAVHWPARTPAFEVVWTVYSYSDNRRVRVKALAADGEPVPSVVDLWAGADWLEREVFDMFGITFSGHPDLRRILLPEDWTGHPLRKEYPITQQDQQWVHIHLAIESGQ